MYFDWLYFPRSAAVQWWIWRTRSTSRSVLYRIAIYIFLYGGMIRLMTWKSKKCENSIVHGQWLDSNYIAITGILWILKRLNFVTSITSSDSPSKMSQETNKEVTWPSDFFLRSVQYVRCIFSKIRQSCNFIFLSLAHSWWRFWWCYRNYKIQTFSNQPMEKVLKTWVSSAPNLV